jgi:hypothetical protein
MFVGDSLKQCLYAITVGHVYRASFGAFTNLFRRFLGRFQFYIAANGIGPVRRQAFGDGPANAGSRADYNG